MLGVKGLTYEFRLLRFKICFRVQMSQERLDECVESLKSTSFTIDLNV